jgi:GNAT superfamily N-acetyltransferase
MLPLAPHEYPRVSGLLKSLPMNTLFARAVVEGHVAGRVYVDDRPAPEACYVAHPYGMALLSGSPARGGFIRGLARYLAGDALPRPSPEWLQVFPGEWSAAFEDLLGGRLVEGGSDGAEADAPAGDDGVVVQYTRVNFRFDPARHARLRESLELPRGCELVDDVDFIYERMRGSVVPRAFWDSAADLRERGAAFALTCRGELASAAFASFVVDGMLELGIETDERFRGRGFSVYACSALIDYCTRRGLEPVWACRLENAASYRLAIRLGFDPVRQLPYYRLPASPDAVMRHAR